MPDHPTPKRRLRPRWVVPALTLAVVLVGSVWATTTVMSDAWSRGQIDLVESFTGSQSNAEWPYFDGTTDQTAQVCAQKSGCVQAVGNQYLTLLEFDGVGSARVYAAGLGSDGVQIDPLVVHFNGKPLRPEIREEIVRAVSGVNASSPD